MKKQPMRCCCLLHSMTKLGEGPALKSAEVGHMLMVFCIIASMYSVSRLVCLVNCCGFDYKQLKCFDVFVSVPKSNFQYQEYSSNTILMEEGFLPPKKIMRDGSETLRKRF